jgi:hypothetical protein
MGGKKKLKNSGIKYRKSGKFKDSCTFADVKITGDSANRFGYDLVAGDFNGWKVDDASRMEPNNGAWVKRFELKHGKYRYRFVVDGKWTDDPTNESRELNPYGETDSLIEISHKK